MIISDLELEAHPDNNGRIFEVTISDENGKVTFQHVVTSSTIAHYFKELAKHDGDIGRYIETLRKRSLKHS